MKQSINNCYVADKYSNLTLFAQEMREQYAAGTPFPHITIDNFFDNQILEEVADTFPNLSKDSLSTRFKNNTEIKLASARGDKQQSEPIRYFLRYLNSSPFIDFLQQLTSINEPLIPDPHFLGGGLHEIKPGGLLKIHADFCRHYETGLDRRINILIYLNRDWQEEYGGHLQLWDSDMKRCEKRFFQYSTESSYLILLTLPIMGIPTQ
ncbi:MAG: 2OG-Fe(II) oxygenase [Cyanobacteria bacterium LVE1205-1]|jgi:Rps23 Pro-64 3,4-dihydroxylase Tpa1-like proline 4-hydroxylase